MKKVKITILLLSILIFAFSLIEITQGYSQEPTIYFDGRKKEISFINVNNGDLFNNLKDLMPGDIRKQNILLKLDNINTDINVFFKIVDDKTNGLPNEISIKLYSNGNELEQKDGFINLGTITKDEEVNLEVVVDVPKEVDNEIQGLEHNIKWKIFIQEDEESDNMNTVTNTTDINSNNEEDNLVEVPYTYDNSNINIYIIACIISFLVMIYFIIILKKEKNKDNK